MIRHVSVFTLKDKTEMKRFVEMLEELGKTCPLVKGSEIGTNISPQQDFGPHFGDVIQIVDLEDETALKQYPTTAEHQKLLREGPQMECVTAIDYYL